ncbi:Integral membrane protein YggT, involved in response to extracytoplasmic stress (osmotic shock) [hydrothermal vent metagenome]|uniref:Integral membrane protein YggT, involved in response to extracytoplasmic stress (Osmotic shock) n=1 Tax=hydrothermal vent metagenome TaxID=652676 RepID=A0A1W1EHI4_9ZZZZ
MSAFIYALVMLIHNIINVYIIIIFISAVLSFVRPDPNNTIVQVIYRLTEPLFYFIRQKMPFVIFSGVDLSPLVILFGLQFLDNFLIKLVF